MVKQLSVFLENSQGSLAKATQAFSEANIDILAASLADTSDFGIFRTIVDSPEKAMDTLKAGGYTVKLTPVLALGVQDRPGELSRVMKVFVENNIQVEYMYSLVRTRQQLAVLILKVSELSKAEKLLESVGYPILSQEDLV